MLNKNKIIPALSTHQAIKKFCKTNLEYGLIMNFQLSQIPQIVKDLKACNKKVIVHLELIKGLSNDEYGAIYLIQELKVDGIITTKPKVVQLCKKRNVLGIMRFFLKDKLSLEQSINLLKQTNPSMIEVLPALPSKLHHIRAHMNNPILMGGLIETKEEVNNCLNEGAIAITTSKESLWVE